MSIVSVMPSNHLILCHPLLLLSSIFPSMRVFSNESALRIRWPKYCSYTFSISPSSEFSGLLSFRIDWFDLLVVQGTLRSLLHSLESSVVRHSGLTLTSIHDYWKHHSFDSMDLWPQVMSLLCNMLSRLVIDVLPRSKRFLISWVPLPSTVILEPRKVKFVTVSTFSPSICH